MFRPNEFGCCLDKNIDQFATELATIILSAQFIHRMQENTAFLGDGQGAMTNPHRGWELPLIFIIGQVAQSVEQGTENPRVGSSILPLATAIKQPI